ncbi:SH3 domain-containing protein [Candidatus Latescibacterota bacterium]
MKWNSLFLSIIIVLLPTRVFAQQPDITLEHKSTDCVCLSGRIDLDNDGTLEMIHVWFLKMGRGLGGERFIVEVNTSTMVCTGDALNQEVQIVDIDSTDHYLEIAVAERGPSSDHATSYFRYGAGSLCKIGKVPSSPWKWPLVDGSGYIKTECRGEILHTWFYPSTYRNNSYGGNLRHEQIGFPVMNTPVTLKVDLEVLRSRRDREVVGIIKQGEKATLLETDNRSWCKIRSENGIEGWFGVIGYSVIAGTGKEGGEVFDGLSFAD